MFNFLLSNRNKILIIVCAIILLALLIVLIVILSKNDKLKKQISSIENKVDDLNVFINSSFNSAITRLEVIGESNEDYKNKASQYTQAKNSIVSKYKVKLDQQLQNLHNLSTSKASKKKIKNLINIVNGTYNSYYAEIHELEEDLRVYLDKDDEGRDKVIPYQRRYQDIKKLYNAHLTELNLVNDSFEKFFKRTDEIFAQYDNLILSAKYDEANELIEPLNKVFDKLFDALNVLPNLCTRVDLVIPDKINNIKTIYEQLDNEKYSLVHLKVNARLQEYQISLDNIVERLKRFSYKNISNELDELDANLLDIEKSFNDEKEARKFCDSNIENVYENANEIEKRFLKIKRAIPTYKEYYWIKDSYVNVVSDLQNQMELIAKLKRELDAYLHASTYVYSSLKAKVDELINEINTSREKIEDLQNYLKSLKEDTDFAYKVMHEKYLSLKEEEYFIREINIPSYVEKMMFKVNQAYQALNDISIVIKVKPINVESIKNSSLKVLNLESEIKSDVDDKYNKMHEAEDAIVHANLYRQEFHDARVSLVEAEDDFYNLDFVSSLNKAASTMKNVNPVIGK